MHRHRATRLRASLSVVALLAGGCLALPAAALANRGGEAIIRQCLNTDRVTGHYSQKDYQYALSHLPTDVAEYSDCPSVIRRAQLAAASAGSPGASGLGAATQGNGTRDPFATATPGERGAIVGAQRSRPGPVRVGSGLVDPGMIALRPASFIHTLPPAMLAALIALGVGALLGGVWVTSARVRARRSR